MAKIIRNNTLCGEKSRVRVSVSDIYENFLRVKKSECSASTHKIYRDMGRRIIVPKLTELTDDDINAVDADMIRTILDEYALTHEDGGVTFLYRHIKCFLNWYWDEYEIPTRNPISKVKVKTTGTKPKEGITQEEVDKLLETAKKESVFPERDVAIIMLLCDTGIRRSSISNIKMQDVDLNKSELLVFEKDQRYHTKVFGASTCKALKRYMRCLTDYKPEDPFWLQLDGTALSQDGMREVLRRLCKQAGIGQHFFHDFRRYYGKTLYESTHDIYLVSRALDHKDIYVTKRYIAIDDRENAEALRSCSPMDKKFRQTGVNVQR